MSTYRYIHIYILIYICYYVGQLYPEVRKEDIFNQSEMLTTGSELGWKFTRETPPPTAFPIPEKLPFQVVHRPQKRSSKVNPPPSLTW